MLASSFFVKESASFVIELVAHNSNRDMLSYIVLTFYQTPAGKVHKDIRVFSLALFGWDVGVDKLGYFIGRLLPGAIYMTLVVAFTIMLYQEMQTEHTRRSVAESAEKSGLFTTIFTFFASDVFRPVDAISYLMSFWSFVLFVLWLVKEGDLQQKLQGNYGEIVDFASELIAQEKEYNRISAANLLLLFVRPLRFIREDPRMQRLNQTLQDAKTDIFWFIVVLCIVLFACTLLANVSFGPFFPGCIDISASFLFCFSFILGEFDFWSLYRANPVMAVIFFFPYLILVYCVFTNIFFAILDRFFVSADPPPMKLKRKLKPLLSKICRCIDWDDDFVMEEDPKGAKKEGPQSRADRVAVTAKIIHDIRKGLDGDSGSRLAQSKPLTEVCDVDEKLSNVVKWSKEEAASIVSEFQNLLVKKQRHKNEDVFLKQVVMKKVDADETKTREEMEEAHRQMRYAAEVHEVMAVRDQQTLAKYIWLLEQKIQKKMTDKHALMMEVQHLQDEMDKMRFTKEDLRNQANGVGADVPQEEDEGSASEAELGEMIQANFADMQVFAMMELVLLMTNLMLATGRSCFIPELSGASSETFKDFLASDIPVSYDLRKKAELDTHSARDSFIPLFDGSLTGYREWRKRIKIYYKKMTLSKRQGEAILNLLGSLSGVAWKLCEDFNLDKAEDPEALQEILKILDGSFQYDSNVEMLADFSAYFEHLARKPGQTLLNYVTTKPNTRLVPLTKTALTREEKQMIMTQAASLERAKIQQSMFAILGQDYKGGGHLLRDRWNRAASGKARSYFAGDDSEAMG
eukprot:g28983.t1